jgi:uncharacterized membrane protein YjfL (UPF0719 family)
MDYAVFLKAIVASIVFSAIGLGVFCVGYALVKRLFPFDVNREIEEDQNTALAILIGSFILGLAIIIAAAIHG